MIGASGKGFGSIQHLQMFEVERKIIAIGNGICFVHCNIKSPLFRKVGW